MGKRRGILLIALGSPYYGQLAANLAASIKYTTGGRMPVHLVWAENALSHLTQQKLGLFTSMQECPREFYHVERNGKEAKSYVKAKTHMNDLSPFEETIFLDVDSIMLGMNTLEKAFEDLKHLDFTMENRGRINLARLKPQDDYLWADVRDVKRAYSFEEGFLYGLHSEFVYWKKCEKLAAYFETVKEVFENPKCKMKHVFDGDIPDEFAFAVAMIKHRIYPHENPFRPLYWYLTDAKSLGTSKEKIIANHYGYSVGGNATPPPVRRFYDQVARAYFSKLGVQYPYKIKQKRQELASRKSM
jgi:hypothetical protein